MTGTPGVHRAWQARRSRSERQGWSWTQSTDTRLTNIRRSSRYICPSL